MTAKPVRVAFIADTADLRQNLSRAETAMDSAASEARSAGQRIDSAFDSTGEHADDVASKGSQAAGALSGLGDLVGGKFGSAMVAGGVAMQGFADAGDLVNVVTESAIVRKIKDTAATIGHTIASKSAAAASKAWAIAQGALNAVMALNPIFLVVLAVAALVAIFIVAYKKSDTFRAIVDKAFKAVKDIAEKVAKFFTDKVPKAFDKITAAAGKVMDWVRGHWPLLLAIITGPIGLAVLAIAKNWDRIKDGAAAVKDFIRDKFNAVLDFFRGLPSKIANATRNMWDGIKDSFRGVINTVIGWWNNLSMSIDIPNAIPGLPNSFSLNTPDIPYLASGGIVTRPTLAVIGEAGPEAVIPLGGAGLRSVVQIEISSSGRKVDDMLMELLRGAIRVKGGGNVQKALGT